jgi:hypothetical protein
VREGTVVDRWMDRPIPGEGNNGNGVAGSGAGASEMPAPAGSLYKCALRRANQTTSLSPPLDWNWNWRQSSVEMHGAATGAIIRGQLLCLSHWPERERERGFCVCLRVWQGGTGQCNSGRHHRRQIISGGPTLAVKRARSKLRHSHWP